MDLTQNASQSQLTPSKQYIFKSISGQTGHFPRNLFSLAVNLSSSKWHKQMLKWRSWKGGHGRGRAIRCDNFWSLFRFTLRALLHPRTFLERHHPACLLPSLPLPLSSLCSWWFGSLLVSNSPLSLLSVPFPETTTPHQTCWVIHSHSHEDTH